MTEAVFVIGTFALLVGFGMILRKRRCPSCNKRALEITFQRDVRGRDRSLRGTPGFLVGYTCTACHAEWRSHNHGPLILREAYENGVREVPPEARALPPKERE